MGCVRALERFEVVGSIGMTAPAGARVVLELVRTAVLEEAG